MKWILQPAPQTTDKMRTYIHDKTGEVCVMDVIYTDKDGNLWWGFRDLFAIPYMRINMSQSLANLFNVGLTRQDLKAMFAEFKGLLKPADGKHDPEKYEKLYSNVLQKEAIVDSTTDPNIQYLTMATIYCCADHENIEYFTHDSVAAKLEQWAPDEEMSAFFLTWYEKHMAAYMQDLNRLSQIVSSLSQQMQNPEP